ncbi:MAG TPA: permease-like cell division protein FtsX [Kineosporiaceae bacterium]|nr:permease-like cell division protein FtsX [Kineosporiaceae bacterium]
MRFQFMLSEIGLGLRRNLSMTISVILVTTVSLLMLGVGLLAQKQVSVMKEYWYDRVQVSIFLCGQDSDKSKPSCASGEVTQAQKDAILAELRSAQLEPYVAEVFYESKQEAYQHLREEYKDSSLVDNVTPDQMPESYRVRLNHPEQYEIVSAAFRGQAGVDTVQDDNVVLDRLFALLNGLKWSAWVIAALTLVCSVLLVATTIRLTAFTRRRETGIMRLVGASNLVIQMPFILESLISAVIGAVLASAILVGFTQFAVQGWLAGTLRFIRNWVGLQDAVLVLPTMFLVGLGIAGISSFLSLRRYLKI